MRPPTLLELATFGLLIGAGCGASQDVVRVVQVSSSIIAEAEPCLMSEYKREQEDCLAQHPDDNAAQECVDSVRAKWKPIVDALGELRDVRCEIEPAKCPAKE